MKVTGVKPTYLTGDQRNKRGKQGKQERDKDKHERITFEEVLKQAKKNLDIKI